MKFAIPKFHVKANGRKCEEDFDPSNITSSALTHGEVCERVWSHLGLFVRMCKEMRPENRRALLEDVIFFLWNRAHDQLPVML
jgi:Kyakuja-Dileera-Zisupton transposase